MAHFQEVMWHRIYWRKLQYDFSWVMEQDVAWKGILFDFFASFASWPQDFICTRPTTKLVGLDEPEFLIRVPGMTEDLTKWHSGWMNSTHGAPRLRCYVFLVRYSASLLNDLAAHHSAGQWGYSEMEAPHFCSQLPNCSIGNLFEQRKCSNVIGDPFSANGRYKSRFVYNPLALQVQVFHSVKH